MPLKITLIGLVSFLSLGISSCGSLPKVDAFECVLVTVDEQANERPLDQWYWFCKNQKSGEKKSIWLKDSTKCIRENKPCKWYGTDILEVERVFKFIKESNQCNY